MSVSTLPQKGQSPSVLVNTAGLSREQWLAWRRRGIGGSDVAAIFGISPFHTARDVYYDKLNIAPAEPDEGNWVALEMGHLLEDLVARIFSRKTGFPVFQIKKMFRHTQYPFMLADVDYFANLPGGETAIVEIKTTNYNAKEHWWTPDGKETVPAWYETQGRHYMAVMNLDRIFFCCLYGNSEGEVIIRELRRDAMYEEEMIFLEKDFWENHVQAKCPPPYLEDGGLIVASAKRYGGPADSLASAVPLDAEMTDILMRYLRLVDEKKTSETISKKREEELLRLRAILIAQMGPSYMAGCERDGIAYTLPDDFDVQQEADRAYGQFVRFAKAQLEENSAQILREMAKERHEQGAFTYHVQNLLFHIKDHPKTRSRYPQCCEYLHRFYTQKQPEGMSYEVWCHTKLTEAKVLAYLKRALAGQNARPERDEIVLVKQGGQFVYKGYSAKARRRLTDAQKMPVPVYQAVLDGKPGEYPGYARLLRKKRAEYDCQEQCFEGMAEDDAIGKWLKAFSLYDTDNEELIQFNETQRHDLNLMLQKRYGLLQWEQGSGKTLAGIASGLYRMQFQNAHSTWVISSAISIRNNWNVVLKSYCLPFVFVERLRDLERIRPGDFVLITLNKVSQYKKQITKKVRMLGRNIQLVLDESDEITNPSSIRCKASLSCFRRCRYKLLTTGTITRNNIVEFAPQLEFAYNNSINMLSWAPCLYCRDRKTGEICEETNSWYGKPIPAYKSGYALFSASHLPEKITVFGRGQLTQDIYNAETLSRLLGKTVITRTFEEVVGKEIKRLHQVPVQFAPQEKALYEKAIEEFEKLRSNYFGSTGNARKDSMLRLMQQLTLLLRISAAPNTLREYQGDMPVKVITAVEMAAGWPDEIVAVGVRHKAVLQAYAAAFREYLPERQLFLVTGSEVSFAQRRALRKTLKASGNGILLCTQQSLPSSVNFEYVNRIIIPELHYNNSGMSQFHMRFIRYTSTEYKDVYFLTYAGSIESNLMQMVLAKEKLNLFMKGQDVDLDEIYNRFGVDYDLLSLMMRREADENGMLHIRWGEQMIA